MSLMRPPKIVNNVDALIAIEQRDKNELIRYMHRKRAYLLGRAEHLVSKILRILGVRRLGFATTLAQAPGEIGGGKGAVEVKVRRRFCDVRRDGEIGRGVRWERVLRRRVGVHLLLERRRGPRGRRYQCGYQCPVWEALVELQVCVASCSMGYI